MSSNKNNNNSAAEPTNFEQRLIANQHLVAANLVAQVKNIMVIPNWIEDTDCFWIKLEDEKGHQFFIVDAETGSCKPAFDHATVATALTKAGIPDVKQDALPLAGMIVDGVRRTLILGEKRFACAEDGSDFSPAQLEPVGEWKRPDHNQVAFVQDHNLWVKDADGSNRKPLTEDGESLYAYGDTGAFDNFQVDRRRSGKQAVPAGIHWSSDGRYLVSLRMDRRNMPLRTHVCEFAAPDKKYIHSITNNLLVAGDHCPPSMTLTIVDVEGGQVIPADISSDLLLDFAAVHYENGTIWWLPGKLFIETGNWLGNRYGVAEVDLATGACRQVIEESETHYYAYNSEDYNCPNVRIINQGHELIWYSQRSGWGHLYLYDVESGRLKNAITQGDWVVWDLLHVDESKRLVYFTAAGKESGRHPYFRHLYRCGLDGGEPELLTPEAADHQFDNPGMPGLPDISTASMSPGGRYFVDCYSTVSQAPVGKIRRADGSVVSVLYEADISALHSVEGWQAPEPIETLADDGKTTLYGIMYKPVDFDPDKKYPVLDFIYSGPQGKHTPTTFMNTFGNACVHNGQLIANLGFIVVTFDGRGCSGRSRDFRYAFAGTEDVFGSADQVAGLRHLAEQYPFMDINRVGISGASFGGYGSCRAQLLHKDFFKACVSIVGPNDYRQMGTPITNDRFFRTSDDVLEAEEYFELISNTRLAERLEGKLLLVYGEIDENVPLNQSFLMLEALQKAGKDYDNLILVNTTHNMATAQYLGQRMLRYFYKNLNA